MMHLAIGLGLVGFFLAHRRHRRYRAYGCGAGPGGFDETHGPGHGWPHGGLRRGRRWVLRRLFHELEATPAQERAIVAELDGFEQRARAAADLVRGARGELVQAMSGTQLDEGALAAAVSRWDSASSELREAGVSTLRAVHALLDEGQRLRLGELLEKLQRGRFRRGPWGHGHAEGPFR